MRRSRFQVRPNVGGRPNKTNEVKKEETNDVKDTKSELSAGIKVSPKRVEDEKKTTEQEGSSEPVRDQSKEKAEDGQASVEPKALAATSTGTTGRRSRIKPQVKIMAKARGSAPVSNSTEKTAEVKVTEVKATELKVTEVKASEVKATDKVDSPVTISDEGDTSQPLEENASANLSKSKTVDLSQETETEKDKGTGNVSVTQGNQEAASSAESLTKEVTPTPQRRSGFTKPKPNISESARKRARLSSLSGASDTDEESHQSLVRKAPPPVQRMAALASPTHAPDSAQGAGYQSPAVETGGASMTTNTSLDTSPVAMEVEQEVSVAATTGITQTVRTEEKARSRLDARKKARMKRENVKVRKTSALTDPVDKVTMRISDLIYYNPTSNRMKSTLEEEERKKKVKENKDGAEGSVVGSPRRTSVVGSPDRQSVVSADNVSVPRSRTNSVIADPDSADEKEDEPLLVPQLKVGADGQIILNEESLVVDNPNLDRTIEEEGEIVEEFSNSTYKASQYYGKLCKTKLWSWRETKKFYLALSVIGSDFSMMASLFPGRDRVDLKKKFKKEEKQNRWLVDKALKDTKTYDISIFDTLSSSDDEETKKLKEKQEKQKKRSEAKETKRLEREKIRQQKREEQEKTKSAKKKKRGKKRLMSQYYDASSSGDSDTENDTMAAQAAITPIPGLVLQTPSPVVKYNCELCEKSFKSKSALRAHIHRHTRNLNLEMKGNQIPKEEKNNTERRPPSPLVSPPANLTPSGQQQQQQLLFVTSSTPADKDGKPGKSVVHMYMVSPPPSLPQIYPAANPEDPSQLLSASGGQQSTSGLGAGGAVSLVDYSASQEGNTVVVSPADPDSTHPTDAADNEQVVFVLPSPGQDSPQNPAAANASATGSVEQSIMARVTDNGLLWTSNDNSVIIEEDGTKECDPNKVVLLDISGPNHVKNITSPSTNSSSMVQPVVYSNSTGSFPHLTNLTHPNAETTDAVDVATNPQMVFVQQMIQQSANGGPPPEGITISHDACDTETPNMGNTQFGSNISVSDIVSQVSGNVINSTVIMQAQPQRTEGMAIGGNSQDTSVLVHESGSLSKQSNNTNNTVSEEVKTIRIKIFNSPGTDQPNFTTDEEKVSQEDTSESASEIRLFLS